MKLNLKAALAGVVSAGIAGGGLLALTTTSAFAASTAPPWEPDTNAAPAYGNVVLYDSAGNEVTSGTNLTSPFSFVAGTTAADAASTKAIVNFYNPQHGVLPANWTGTAEGASTAFRPLAATNPADLVALTTGTTVYPVASTTANISTWLASNTPDTTAGYANTIQVRLTETAGELAGTYWESDIGYNTTAAPITVDGTTVPANGWALLFPFVNVSTTTVSTSAVGGHFTQTGTNTLTVTATVTPGTAAGGVNFYDNGTFLSNVTTPGAGTYTLTTTPAVGSHSYTASFIAGDAPGDPTSPNTTSATIVGGSTSAAAPVSVTPPQTATTTTLSASSTSINFGATETLTATSTAADSSAQAGTTEFFVGATPITGCTAVATTTPTPDQCVTTSLPSGTDSVTAVFTPTSTSYATSTSAAVVITVAAPAVCSLSGSSCTDTQNIQVTVNPGTITITTPYTSTNPFVLPAMTLSSDGTFFQSSATFPATTLPNSQQIVVTSSVAPAYAWTLSVSATPLSSAGGGTIPASGLGLTNGALLNGTGTGAYPGSVTFTGIPALNPSPVDGPGTGPGLSATPQTFAHSTAADGTAEMNGTLTLFAATNTPAGTYNGTITFTVS